MKMSDVPVTKLFNDIIALTHYTVKVLTFQNIYVIIVHRFLGVCTMMKIVFRKLTEKGFEYREFIVNGVKYGGWLIAIDIVDVGWRTLTSEQYDSFEITML